MYTSNISKLNNHYTFKSTIKNANMMKSTNELHYSDVILHFFLVKQHNICADDLPKPKKNVHFYICLYTLISVNGFETQHIHDI